MTVQIVEISGQKIAMLPMSDYERLLDMAEDKADAVAAAQAEMRRAEGEEYLPSEMVDQILAGESALKVWRKHRQLTQGQLGEMVGCQSAFISKMEKGESEGGVDIWLSLAKALGVAIEDIRI